MHHLDFHAQAGKNKERKDNHNLRDVGSKSKLQNSGKKEHIQEVVKARKMWHQKETERN